MKQSLLTIFTTLIFSFFFLSPLPASAIENPISVPNNKVGIHILFDHELGDAAKLVNTNGGDWGYIIIPIQSGDKDIVKWQRFMDAAKQNHIIPIIRMATEGDYFNTQVWRKPTPMDVIDSANFLSSLDWPVRNRYVVVYNEVNRGDEWGGSVNPAEYAELLSFAVSVLKSKSPDFFVISAGLDNAAPNKFPLYMNQYEYLNQMETAVPGVFNQIDGLSSHSYPNPGFSQPPNTQNRMGVNSFAYERDLVQRFTKKDLPVFITETGWSTEVISEEQQAAYYQQTFAAIWNDPRVVAVLPFLLQGTGGPFQKFTFIGEGGRITRQYEALQSMPKIKGVPHLPVSVLAAETLRATPKEKQVEKVEKKKFTPQPKTYPQELGEWVLNIYKWLTKI